MKHAMLATMASLLALIGAATLMPGELRSAAPQVTADAAHPAVIELYQSQGCSSCPPALKVLQVEADRPDVIALSFAVTYWDQLGWKDRFASPAYTKRQWDYARSAGRGQVATPQLIVNGRSFVNGGNRAEVDAAIARWDRGRGGPTIAAGNGSVTIGAGAARSPATVWLVNYDPRTIDVPIRAGENNGRTLPHRNIVTGLTRLGEWSGAAIRYNLPAARNGMKRAVLVQSGSTGPMIAAGRIG
jgi:hypothetical protein